MLRQAFRVPYGFAVCLHRCVTAVSSPRCHSVPQAFRARETFRVIIEVPSRGARKANEVLAPRIMTDNPAIELASLPVGVDRLQSRFAVSGFVSL